MAREKRDPLVDEVDRYADVYFPAYRDGHLLVRGGIGDQPGRYLEMINLFRDAERRMEAKFLEITKKQSSAE